MLYYCRITPCIYLLTYLLYLPIARVHSKVLLENIWLFFQYKLWAQRFIFFRQTPEIIRKTTQIFNIFRCLLFLLYLNYRFLTIPSNIVEYLVGFHEGAIKNHSIQKKGVFLNTNTKINQTSWFKYNAAP